MVANSVFDIPMYIYGSLNFHIANVMMKIEITIQQNSKVFDTLETWS
jgi:hypothetical protein